MLSHLPVSRGRGPALPVCASGVFISCVTTTVSKRRTRTAAC